LVLWLARLRSIVNEHLATSKDDSSQTRKWDQVRDNELLLAEWALANVTFLNRQVGCHLVLAASFLEIAEARIEELLGKGNPNRAPTATNAAAETHEAADNSTPTSQNYIG